jgi:hypothetical protein
VEIGESSGAAGQDGLTFGISRLESYAGSETSGFPMNVIRS